MTAIEVFKGSNYYSEFLDSFSITPPPKLDVDFNGTAISEAIFFHLCKMKYAGWRHRVNFNRHRKHSLSDLFQDIVAFYMRATLPDSFGVHLEMKVGKVQPDIVVLWRNSPIFIVELKTNIGWDRPDMGSMHPYKKMEERIELLSTNFSVKKENIVYIFEDHGNVSKNFSQIFWDEKRKVPTPRPSEFPLSAVFPLFDGTDPYYWKHEGLISKNTHYIDITDKEIRDRAAKSIVSPIEKILEKVIKAKNAESAR
jgi:hypothetical protein